MLASKAVVSYEKLVVGEVIGSHPFMIRCLSLLENTSEGNSSNDLTAKSLIISFLTRGLSILDWQDNIMSRVSPAYGVSDNL